ncbi:MAG TPA: glycoside hydrolase domain-containing protein [Steroidobacteraceae bacterium]|nr:glycoside hydrolase domain-containing protein [Steroidobacteraceae bacterium]
MRKWAAQAPGLHAAFGDTGRSYLRSEVPAATESRSWEAAGWRGERLNVLVLVWSPDSLEQVRLTMTDLTDERGHVLSRKQVRPQIVRYVLSDYPYGAQAQRCESRAKPAWLMPDRLESFERFDLAARTVRPVWISIDIPETTEAGTYAGDLQLSSTTQSVTLRVSVKVQQPILPPPHEWKFRLDLWQNPWVVARYYELEPWSDEHKALLERHLKLYAEAGGKYVTTYAIDSPWQDASYWVENTMIEWIRQRDGSWRFDYRIFDDYVSLARRLGIDHSITLYTLLPWGHRFRYLDETTGNYVYQTWPPTSPEYRSVWHTFLDDLKRHLEQKDWLGSTYLGINENPLEDTLAAIRVIKEHSPDWRITYAGDWHAELDGLVDDYSAAFTAQPDDKAIEARAARRSSSTYYVACWPPTPNTFVFSPPAEGRWLGWYAVARGYDGFLRWAYDAWPADPMRDARHTAWPAGDAYLVYPGGESSVRFEKLREGIVDFEKIRLLRAKLKGSADPQVRTQMGELDRLMESIAAAREVNEGRALEEVSRGNRAIAALSEAAAF